MLAGVSASTQGGETTHDIRFIETEREIQLSADGLICARFNTYGEAWKHAAWMHKATGQEFTIEGQPAEEWFDDLMDTFLWCMKKAYKSGGLYCDNVVSKEKAD